MPGNIVPSLTFSSPVEQTLESEPITTVTGATFGAINSPGSSSSGPSTIVDYAIIGLVVILIFKFIDR